MAEKQMEELQEELEQPELEQPEEEEIEHPYLDKIQMMDRSERMNRLRSLISYSKSKEWIEVKGYAKEKDENIKNRIEKEAYSRMKTKKEWSIIDERVWMVLTLTEIAEKTTNEVLKDYIMNYQVDAYKSFITNKSGYVFLNVWSWDEFNAVPVLVDEAIYTKLDMLKKQKAIYHSIGRILTNCIETYDIEWLLQKTDKEPENPHQPYE